MRRASNATTLRPNIEAPSYPGATGRPPRVVCNRAQLTAPTSRPPNSENCRRAPSAGARELGDYRVSLERQQSLTPAFSKTRLMDPRPRINHAVVSTPLGTGGQRNADSPGTPIESMYVSWRRSSVSCRRLLLHRDTLYLRFERMAERRSARRVRMSVCAAPAPSRPAKLGSFEGRLTPRMLSKTVCVPSTTVATDASVDLCVDAGRHRNLMGIHHIQLLHRKPRIDFQRAWITRSSARLRRDRGGASPVALESERSTPCATADTTAADGAWRAELPGAGGPQE